MREPYAHKTGVLCGTSYAHKTLHKTFIREKSYACLMRLLGLHSEVLCESYAGFFSIGFFSYKTQYIYMLFPI